MLTHACLANMKFACYNLDRSILMEGQMKLYFVLAPAPDHFRGHAESFGIFATQDIAMGTKLPLFAKDDYRLWPLGALRKLPPLLRERLLVYGVLDDSGLHGPKDPNKMSIGWYIRHADVPTAVIDERYDYFAARDIKAGEEVTVDLHTLEDVRYPPRMKQ